MRWRLQRLCQGLGITLADLDGWLHIWFRPPLRLSDQTAVELAEYAAELDLDVLWVDSWSYVATGDSNSSDDVTPQLQALSYARVLRPGLTVGLTHHARKDNAGKDVGTRLTDEIRNSGAFGAWYDAGIVLSRRDEMSPVTVRAELRDFATPDSFAFIVKDEDPAEPHNGHRSGGWLRLDVSDHRPETLERIVAAEKLVPAVREYLGANPSGVSRRQLREITGRNADIEAAFDLLKKAGEAEYVAPEKKGGAATYRLLPGGCAPPCPDCAPGTGGEGCARCAPTPVGVGTGTLHGPLRGKRARARVECVSAARRSDRPPHSVPPASTEKHHEAV